MQQDTSKAEEDGKTTVIDNYAPVHAINNYLWSRVGNEGGEAILVRDNYKGPGMSKGLVPIVPVEEAPDLITIIEGASGITSHPYMIYTWNRINTGDMWFVKTHQIAYSVRSADDRKLGQMINLFAKEFESYDKAAQNVNKHMAGLSATYDPLKRFKFKHISVSTLSGGLPAESENGVSEALVTLSVTFTE